jgi:hypothetical protein
VGVVRDFPNGSRSSRSRRRSRRRRRRKRRRRKRRKRRRRRRSRRRRRRSRRKRWETQTACSGGIHFCAKTGTRWCGVLCILLGMGRGGVQLNPFPSGLCLTICCVEEVVLKSDTRYHRISRVYHRGAHVSTSWSLRRAHIFPRSMRGAHVSTRSLRGRQAHVSTRSLRGRQAHISTMSMQLPAWRRKVRNTCRVEERFVTGVRKSVRCPLTEMTIDVRGLSVGVGRVGRGLLIGVRSHKRGVLITGNLSCLHI